MTYILTIHAKLPGLNEFTRENRANRYGGNSMKRSVEQIIIAAIRESGIPRLQTPVALTYVWYEPNKRRDWDNIMFAQKFVQDALVSAGCLPGDGWKDICRIEHRFAVDKQRPRVVVRIEEGECVAHETRKISG